MNSEILNYLSDSQKKIPPTYFEFCQRNIPHISCDDDRMTMKEFIGNLTEQRFSVSNSVLEFCYKYSDVQVLEELQRICLEHYLFSIIFKI